jgi:hypothetical protein
MTDRQVLLAAIIAASIAAQGEKQRREKRRARIERIPILGELMWALK